MNRRHLRTRTTFTPTVEGAGKFAPHSARWRGRARPQGALPGIRGGPCGPALPSGLVPFPDLAKAFAFTLLELLAVIAVLGILATLLFPGLSAARVAVSKARTRIQFSEWAAAVEGFRREYGYYPVLDSSGLVNPPGQATDPGLPHLFHDVLAARRRDGSALPAAGGTAEALSAEAQNRKSIAFHAFSQTDFTPEQSTGPNLLCDAGANTEIAVLVDRNLDGVIQAGSDFAALPFVGGIVPGWADFPAAGIRAGVIFYAPAPGATVRHPGFIFSWK